MGRCGCTSDDRRRTVVALAQGDVCWAEAEDQRRPVLIVTRTEAIPVLNRVLVAPVTRTIRNIPTEVALGATEGLSESSVASFDNLLPVAKSFLSAPLGALGPRRSEICDALAALADC